MGQNNKHRKPRKAQGQHRKPPPVTQMKYKAGVAAAGAVAAPLGLIAFSGSAQAADKPSVVAGGGGEQPVGKDVVPAPESPGVAPPDYIVQRGDSFSGIAAMLGYSVDVLKPINPGVIAGDRPDDYSLIFAGGHIHLPADVAADPPAPEADPVPAPPADPPATAPPPRAEKTWYKNCDAAKRDGNPHPKRWERGSGWRSALDWDRDGKACEPVITPPPAEGGGTDTGGSTVPVIAPDAPGTASGYSSRSPQAWAPLALQAMQLTNFGTGQLQDFLQLMAEESSGNPNAINNYDSNAAQGQDMKSKGLMQVIGPTFRANHQAGTSTNIYDPLANMAASLNYIKAQYGGNVPHAPY